MCTIFEGTDVFLQWNEKGLASKDKVKIAKCEIWDWTHNIENKVLYTSNKR